MARYTTTDWRIRRTEKANTFIKTENPDGSFSHLPDEGQIFEEGTPINATNMNKIEEGIYNANVKLDDNGADIPHPDLMGYDNIQDMLTNIDKNYFKAYLTGDGWSPSIVNFPSPLSKYWVIKFYGHGEAWLNSINGISLETYAHRTNAAHQCFGLGQNAVSYSTDNPSELQLFSSYWDSTTSTPVPPEIPPEFFSSGWPTFTEGYMFIINHAVTADNKMAIYCYGKTYDIMGGHGDGGMSYFGNVVYSAQPNTYIENITNMTFYINGHLNLEVMHAPQFASTSTSEYKLDYAANAVAEFKAAKAKNKKREEVKEVENGNI